MDFKVKTMPRPEFDGWVAAMQATENRVADVATTEGEAIFNQSCIFCHATSAVGETGAAGPNLAAFGDRNRVAGFMDHTEDSLKNWIRDTQFYKPGNQMQSFDKSQISDAELDALTKYLMGLTVEK